MAMEPLSNITHDQAVMGGRPCVRGLRITVGANPRVPGQERNIEVGILVEDPSFANYLAGQWLRLVEAGIIGEYRK